ncbi:hypothetical protein ACRAWF_19550 [Streptomyces sp. L7]
MDRSAARRRVRELAEEHGLAVDPEAGSDEGSRSGCANASRSMKLLHRGARTLILDETDRRAHPRRGGRPVRGPQVTCRAGPMR